MSTQGPDASRPGQTPRVPVPFDQESTSVPSPLIPRQAARPDALETFPASGEIPRVAAPIAAPFDQEGDASIARNVDPIRALGDAAVAGAVSQRGAFSTAKPAVRPTPPPVDVPDMPAPPAPRAPGLHQANSATLVAPARAADDSKPSRFRRKAKDAPKPFRPSAAASDDAPQTQTGTGGAGNGGGKPPRSDRERVPFFRRLSTLIVLGILASAGVGAYVVTDGFTADTITLAPHVVNIPLPEPNFEPVAVETASAFMAGLPRATLQYGLTDFTEMTLVERFEWVGRAAEGWTLTYSDGADGVMTVVAYQHYNAEEAEAAFEKIAPPSPDQISPTPEPTASATTVPRNPVTADGVVVGESVKITIPAVPATETDPGSPELTQIIWRNGTAVFIMTADADVIDGLFTEYGV